MSASLNGAMSFADAVRSALALVLPNLAVLVRRLHDTGRSGLRRASSSGLA